MQHGTIIFLLPIISAALAFVLCRLAISMFVNQLVRQRTELVTRILSTFFAKDAATDFIKEKLADPAQLAAVKPLIETHVHTFLNVKLQEKLPVIAMFASPEMIGKISEGLLEEIDLLLPEVINQYAASMLAGLDPANMLGRKISEVPEAVFKAQVMQILGRKLNALSMAAALFGLIIGSLPLILFFF